MNRRRPPAQLPLFGTVAQPRFTRPEPWSLYLAVLTLRRKGLRVCRHGRYAHLVEGKRVLSSKLLIQMAQKP